MTPTPLPVSADELLPVRPRPWSSALRALAIAACVPYLSLKIAWISGSRIGIPDGSMLLDHPRLVLVANSVTVVMDTSVVVLALLLTRPWGLRVPAWLLGVPAWGATGLLLPIMIGFPMQLLATALGGTTAQDSSQRPFLDDWVFGVVYGGFILQGLALGTLAVLYARDRWGHLWRGTMWELPSRATGPAVRTWAVLGSLLALFPALMHLLWAAGSAVALSPGRAAERTTDFYLLEGARFVFVAVACAGTLMLAFRRRPWLPVRLPLAMAWAGASTLGAWGGWLLITSLMPAADASNDASWQMTLTYAGEMISGLLLTAGVVCVLRRRGA
ncbi:hypothetical protein OHS70_28830 [Streptomyces sp. NBC_00390]|uniref:hypothetical protein n=1 Tax=Streptomyces sp. NBC_00390 TaxID=2975736 RepID=UPI002E24FAE6